MNQVRRWSLCALFVGLFGGLSLAAGPFAAPADRTIATELRQVTVLADSARDTPSRVLAAALAITLGPFGAHRILLGTSPLIPVLYSVTFGGFGLLVLIDLGHILFTKDLAAFEDNEQVLMWAGGAPGATPP